MANQQGDGPFGPGDRTIMKPRPGGRGPSPPGTPPPAAPVAPSAPPIPDVGAARAGSALPPLESPGAGRMEYVAAGLEPLVAAAAPLLLLAGRLRHTPEAADVAGLRRQLVAEVRQFEERARTTGVAAEQVAAARYALCATLDEAILSTPWGARGEWGTQPLLSIFHRETWGGEKFFQLIERTKSDPRQYAGLLEVLYGCLSLGFAGKYALDPRGALQRDQLQHEVYERLRSLGGGAPGPLSQRWEGERDKRNPLLRYVPLWVVAAAGLALLTATYLYFRFQLGQAADPTYAALANVGVQGFATGSPAPAAVPSVTLKQLLADVEAQGLLTVDEQGARSVVTLAGSDLFAAGSATINPRLDATLDRIGAALDEVPGSVLVVGHSDGQPIRSFRYQNNFELSAARALAVLERLRAKVSAPSRLQSNGVGSTQPRCEPERTPEDRACNRRVEIVHVYTGGATP